MTNISNRSQVLPPVRVLRLLRQRAGCGPVRGVHPVVRGGAQEHPYQVPGGEAGGGRAVGEDAPQADPAGEPARGHRHLVSGASTPLRGRASEHRRLGVTLVLGFYPFV